MLVLLLRFMLFVVDVVDFVELVDFSHSGRVDLVVDVCVDLGGDGNVYADVDVPIVVLELNVDFALVEVSGVVVVDVDVVFNVDVYVVVGVDIIFDFDMDVYVLVD